MTIVFISHLSTNIAAGLNWSVPASVQAQAKIDNVLWVNMTNAVMPHWNSVEAYHNIDDFGGELNSFECLPTPFDHPDFVVFEGFYYMDDIRIAKMLRKKKIRYIIIPRGSLTNLALHNHAWFKKWVAHKLYFDRYIKHAEAIQYLTKQEAANSSGRFNTPFFIIPNGFNTPEIKKVDFSQEGIKAVFIGRLDMFHKGLDLLLEAFSRIHAELLEAHFFFDIYGPRRYDFERIEKEINQRNISDIAAIHDEVSGIKKEQVLMGADVFMMASRFEGHPMGLIEALAYGLPCMVTPGTNMLEEIRESNAGWTCDGTVESIICTLRQIITERALFSIKGKNGRKLSLLYNWDRLAQLFQEQLTRRL